MALARGAPNATVAQRLGVDRRTIKRHRENCLEPLWSQFCNLEGPYSLEGQLMRLHAEALMIKEEAQRRGDLPTALAAMRNARETIELLALATGIL